MVPTSVTCFPIVYAPIIVSMALLGFLFGLIMLVMWKRFLASAREDIFGSRWAPVLTIVAVQVFALATVFEVK